MPRILSLDDDPVFLSLISAVFEIAGYDYLSTNNSYEAWNMLQTEYFDLFTQDLVRPDIDGYTFYEMMKSDERLRDLPVIIISANSPASWNSTGITAYITKPPSPEELLTVVDEVLNKRNYSATRRQGLKPQAKQPKPT
jgi:CheY-like chemotaxis protein